VWRLDPSVILRWTSADKNEYETTSASGWGARKLISIVRAVVGQFLIDLTLNELDAGSPSTTAGAARGSAQIARLPV
jgi:hypothetical protein